VLSKYPPAPPPPPAEPPPPAPPAITKYETAVVCAAVVRVPLELNVVITSA
jgi:hypothetical protein